MAASENPDLLQGPCMMILRPPSSSAARLRHRQADSRLVEGDLQIEDGSLYPALNRMLLKGWLKSEWGMTDNNRRAHFYRLTPAGRKQLESESTAFNKMIRATSARHADFVRQVFMSWQNLFRRNFLRRNKVDREWREEMEANIDLATDAFLAQGMPPEQARAAALKQAGNLIARREEIYQMNGIGWLDSLWSDFRYALRGLWHQPTFTATALLTLALGIGANTAIFGVIDSILIRPLPYPHAEALVGVWHTASFQGFGDSIECTPSMYFTYRDENRTFQHFGVWSSNGARVTGAAEPELPRSLVVTYGVLDALGVQPLLGRWFSQADDTPGTPETVILTYGYWQRRFGGDQSIIGRTLTINAKPTTVIGVMPREFRFGRDPELILPRRFERSEIFLGDFSYQGIARLRPGVTIAQANLDQARMLKIWLTAWPTTPGFPLSVFQNAHIGPKIQPLKQEVVGDIGGTLWVVM